MITENDFTRVNSDVNGNPRYVIHFLQCEPEAWKKDSLKNFKIENSISERYAMTVKLMNKIGGKKFHNKQYGGGIVFQSYSLPDTIKSIESLKEGVK